MCSLYLCLCTHREEYTPYSTNNRVQSYQLSKQKEAVLSFLLFISPNRGQVIFKLRLGALIPRSVCWSDCLSVCLSVCLSFCPPKITKTRLISIESQPKKIVVVVVIGGVVVVVHEVVVVIPTVDTRNIPLNFG